MNYTLDIDTPIGGWYFSKHTAKEVLAKHQGKEVTVRLNSLGGDLNHGLDIAEQFAEHGNVTVNLVSFNASASTIIALGAKKVRMQADSFYLIHKVMSWVSEWGMMNEDNIQEVIDKLEKEKKENEKITLQMARKYSARTGKSVIDILNLMKQETWLNAEEAKEWGFVDEVYGNASGKVNFAELEGKFNAVGIPFPDKFRKKENSESEGASKFDRVVQKIDDFISAFSGNKDNSTNSNKNSKTVMKKDWTHINALLGVEGVESADGKVNMSEDQLQKINEKLQKAEDELKLANEAKATAEQNLSEKETELQNFKKAKGDDSPPVIKQTDGGGSKENVFGKDMADAQTMYNILNEQ